MITIGAEPTKDFFISMLTRDISLLSALIDLVDNSVDAALATGGFENKNIQLEVSSEQFKIIDNCGGISRKAAEDYAFKFGRPSSAPETPHSVGRFGVGMKRAIFKMGSKFKISSGHKDGSFDINVDVIEWMHQPNSWVFNLDEIDHSGMLGTTILVESLHETIAEKFEDTIFINNLIQSIGKAHFKAINEGLEISVNGIIVNKKDIEIKINDNLNIAGQTLNLKGVEVTIKAGVGDRNLHAGGWYVFCNGRMIEGANKGMVTGWGTDGIRAYHADMAFFRGVIEFNAIDGDKLPWNTTKTGIDSDNSVYRTALIYMKIQMRKIMELLKDRVKEQEDVDAGRSELSPINTSINEAKLTSLFSLETPVSFLRPAKLIIPRKITERKVSFSVKDEILTEVKKNLGVSTNKEAGLLTFEYYWENEC